MKIEIKRQGTETKNLKFSGTVTQLLSKLNINPVEVLVAKNGAIVELDEKLTDKDEVTIFSVVSGG